MTATLNDIATVLNTNEGNVIARCKGLRILPVCGRCGGTGHYSFNGSHSICYGCNGAGQLAPAPKDYARILEDATHAKESGKLDEYLQYLAASKIAKNAGQKILQAWTATGISATYRWQDAADYMRTKNPAFKRDRDLADINAKMAGAYDRVNIAANKLAPKAPSYHADVIALAALVKESLEIIAAAEKEMVDYMNATR